MAMTYKENQGEVEAPLLSECCACLVDPNGCLCLDMPTRQRSRAIPKELPPCDGPKLRLFRHHNAHIQWFERLGNNQDDNVPAEGYVFRAKVNGHEYAIKVVSRTP